MEATYKDLATLLERAAELVRQQAAENDALRERDRQRESFRRKYGMLVDLPDVITAKEIAQFLRVNPNTVYEMFKCGKIKSFGGGANGKSIRCMKTDFIAWLDGERNRSRNEAEEKEKFVPVTIAKGARRMSLIGGRG